MKEAKRLRISPVRTGLRFAPARCLQAYTCSTNSGGCTLAGGPGRSGFGCMQNLKRLSKAINLYLVLFFSFN